MIFKDKVILVTGASQNTGLTIATQFLQEGAHVLINAVDRSNLSAAFLSLQARFGDRVHQFAADIAEVGQVAAMFDYIDRYLGSLDILVNNACNLGLGPSFEQLEPMDFRAVFDVNVHGTFLVSRYAVDRMRRQDTKGAIVNMGSNVSNRAIHSRAAYVASKSAIDGLTKAMAIDLGPLGIRTNTVAPGYIYTNRWENLPNETKDRRRKNIPIGKEATTKQIADAVLFLASDAASNINGTRLVVDGGCAVQHLPIDVDH